MRALTLGVKPGHTHLSKSHPPLKVRLLPKLVQYHGLEKSCSAGAQIVWQLTFALL